MPFRCSLATLLAVLLPGFAPAQTYDPGAPCGRDENGTPYICRQDPSANLEATCLTSADPRYCLPYHQRACQVQGFALACRVYAIGSNCNGGDPNQCNYYVYLLQANRACALDRNQGACDWIRQQGF